MARGMEPGEMRPTKKNRLVVVCGIPRTGTTIVSRIVEALGIPFRGNEGRLCPKFREIDVGRPNGRSIEEFIKLYSTGINGIKIHGLTEWGREIFRKLPVWKLIHTYRDKSSVLNSLVTKRLVWGYDEKTALEKSQNRLWNAERKVKDTVVNWPSIMIYFNDLIDRPVDQIRTIADFLEVVPAEGVLKRAEGLVRPELRHFK